MRSLKEIPMKREPSRDKEALTPGGAEALVSELDTNGIVVLPSLLTAEQLHYMQSAFATRLRRMRWNNVEGYQKTERYRHMVEDVLQLDQGFVDLAVHPLVKQILTRYLGTNYDLTEAKGWKSLPTKRDFHGWHGDSWYGTNTDHYYLANYYDTALVQYINYYRTGDTRFLEYARKTADALWHSQLIGDGTVVQGNDNHLPPRSMAFAGLMLRALDGRPEMWDYLEREVRATFDDWVYRRKNDPKLYYDIRDDGYAQLYAVVMAKVLPDTYPLYANGTLRPRTGAATNGAAKRATYLSQTEDTAVNFFGRLQWADGSWRWNEDGSSPDDQLRDIEQPFMVGLYLESVVLLHQLTRNPTVKANLVKQLTRSVRHLYLDAFQRNNRVTDLPPHRWRSMFYFWRGGSVANPKKFNPPPPKTTANGDRDQVAAARHFQSTVHHAFGYAYYVTGDNSFKEMGDDVFEASFGDRVDGIHCLAASGKAKDYDMNYRASGRYLVWRLAPRNQVRQHHIY